MTDPLTPAELAEIRARAEAATPGPWETRGLDVYQPAGRHIAYTGPQRAEDYPDSCRRVDETNAAFIAAARTDIPRLLREVERLRAENAAMRKWLEHVLWAHGECPDCGKFNEHKSNCALAAMLNGGEHE